MVFEHRIEVDSGEMVRRGRKYHDAVEHEGVEGAIVEAVGMHHPDLVDALDPDLLLFLLHQAALLLLDHRKSDDHLLPTIEQPSCW